ncbi:MAG TPA: carboxyl transferase domain-containing protein, partial [Gammaproteobacteria bacterium]|nr:carboxyl transferase domain-containing protein [Gammaproteobacteria bacterium]
MSGKDWEDAISEIRRRRETAKEQGGPAAVERQHARGRLTIRERIDALVDAGSFREVGPIAGGVERDEQGRMTSFTPGNYVLGFGRIDGRPCVVGGEDFTMAGGSPNV